MIQLDSVTKCFGKADSLTPAVDGVTLSIGPGEKVVLMGESGSGKTTLLHLIGLLTAPSAGQVTIQGVPVGQLGPTDRAHLRNRMIGFVFQHYCLLPDLTVYENVELPLLYQAGNRPTRKKVLDALAAVGMEAFPKRYPGELSGGQQQRVAIARSIITEPPILLADEPTGALDSRTGAMVLDLLDEIHARGRTLLVVTHSSEVAERFPRVLRMEDGRVVSDGRTL